MQLFNAEFQILNLRLQENWAACFFFNLKFIANKGIGSGNQYSRVEYGEYY